MNVIKEKFYCKDEENIAIHSNPCIYLQQFVIVIMLCIICERFVVVACITTFFFGLLSIL